MSVRDAMRYPPDDPDDLPPVAALVVRPAAPAVEQRRVAGRELPAAPARRSVDSPCTSGTACSACAPHPCVLPRRLGIAATVAEMPHTPMTDHSCTRTPSRPPTARCACCWSTTTRATATLSASATVDSPRAPPRRRSPPSLRPARRSPPRPQAAPPPQSVGPYSIALVTLPPGSGEGGGGGGGSTASWNTGSLTQTGQSVTVTNASYNGSVAPGTSTSFGMQGTWTSSDAPRRPASPSTAPPAHSHRLRIKTPPAVTGGVMVSGGYGYRGERSAFLTPSVKAAHDARLKTSSGPAGSFESRTATTRGMLPATSTQLPPFPLL